MDHPEDEALARLEVIKKSAEAKMALLQNNLNPDSAYLRTLDSGIKRNAAVIKKFEQINEQRQGLTAICEAKLKCSDIQAAVPDPCRPGVKDSVQLCQNAGVKVHMVTGDNVQTARAIALECGILTSGADASKPTLIEGKSFRAMTDAERDKISDKISVMGRLSPNDKLLLVQSLRRKGHVVAVTGDGTNDAPALHEADIGLAMGIAGTEVAKESSDIIILDDNFASVVKADGEVLVHWKGASEIVLESCRSYIDEDGNVAPMTEEKALYFRTYEAEKVPAIRE